MLIRVRDVLEVFDQVLRGREEVGEAYLFAVDVVDSVEDGTGRLEDPEMLAPLRELASSAVVTLDIVEALRGRLGTGTDAGTA